jgi:hypothetical protein
MRQRRSRRKLILRGSGSYLRSLLRQAIARWKRDMALVQID